MKTKVRREKVIINKKYQRNRKQTVEKFNKNKRWLFEKIKIIDKFQWAEQESRQKTQICKQGITPDPTDIKTILRATPLLVQIQKVARVHPQD